jgi:hypothetical protein
VIANNGVPNPNSKGFVVNNVKPIGMMFKLSMVAKMQVSQWLIENELVFSTGVNPWTNTQNNRSNKSCEKNIGHCVMNIKMPFLWKRHMFGMQQSIVSGIP